MATFIDSIRAAVDNGFGIIGEKQMSPYQVSLVKVTNDQVNFDSNPNSRVRTETPITVGNGQNPHIQYLTKLDNNTVSVLSGGALSDTEILLGPLALPYDTGFQTGGYDASNFQPGPAAGSTSVYVRVQGFGFNQANGNYFKVKEIVLAGMDNAFYYVRLSGIADVIA